MPMPTEFLTLFNKEHPPEEFETEAVRDEYRRTAYRWFRLGQASYHKDETGHELDISDSENG